MTPRPHSTTFAVKSMLRVLAIAFWLLGFVRASDALRMAYHPDAVYWPWVDAIFGLCFFLIATILWMEARHVGSSPDRHE
jgi:hypothetical protein